MAFVQYYKTFGLKFVCWIKIPHCLAFLISRQKENPQKRGFEGCLIVR